MSTDFRALCTELLGALENEGHAHWPGGPDGDPLIEQARAALAADPVADGPAVQSREPASVAGEPSDKDCWQWYTYCPEEGLEIYSDKKQAQSAAQSIMGSYEVAAHSDGWHEDMESVSWGMLVPVEQAQVVERKTAELGDEFDEWVKYELKAPRWGCPAPAPAGEVAELVEWLRENTEDERQMCESSNRLSLNLDRAADLLEQRHPTPVPVSERLPGPGDCLPWPGEPNAGRWCWMASCVDNGWAWEQRTLGFLASFPQDFTHWLPATALPLPQGEGE